MSEYICPHCQNPIYDDEVLSCHFCGGLLKRSSGGFLGQLRYGQNKILWFLGIVVVLLSFIMLFF